MILKLKSGKFREGCDAEIGTYGRWHSCKRVPRIRCTVTITAGTHRGPSMLYFCGKHVKRANHPLLPCMSNHVVETL